MVKKGVNISSLSVSVGRVIAYGITLSLIISILACSEQPQEDGILTSPSIGPGRGSGGGSGDSGGGAGDSGEGPNGSAPVAANITPANFDEDTESIITLSYTDADGDQATACSASALINVAVTTPCSCTAGGCSIGITGDLNYYGSAGFTYTVTANSDTSNSANASFTIDNVNDAPIVSAVSDSGLSEDIEKMVALAYTDPDADLATSCTVSGESNISITTPCACASGECSVGVTGSANYYGSASFNFTVTANGQTSNSSNANLTISSVNDAPIKNTNSGITTGVGGTTTINSSYLDYADVEDGDSNLTYTVITAPTRGTLKNNGNALAVSSTFTQQDVNDNLITYEHTAGDTTDDSFTFSLKDSANMEAATATASSPDTFNITVGNCVSGSQSFTTNDTFVLPANCTSVTIKAWGGGGGGGKKVSQTAGHGGAGGYVETTVASSGGAQFSIIIGNGGVSGCGSKAGGTGAFSGGTGGAKNTAGSTGGGVVAGGTGGAGNGGTGAGGNGYYGGGGGGGGKEDNTIGAGGGGATLVETSGGTDLAIAGGGGGGGGNDEWSTPPSGGSGCGQNGTTSTNSTSGGGGGGGACLGDAAYTGNGVTPYNSAEGGASGAGGSGGSCTNGTNGKVIIEYN